LPLPEAVEWIRTPLFYVSFRAQTGTRAASLIVVKGDRIGSGKSTQISLLSSWLRSARRMLSPSANGTPRPGAAGQAARRRRSEMLHPHLIQLDPATDFADRMESYILPLVKSGAIVSADR